MQEDFKKLLKPDLYQVLLFTCPVGIPFSFARHPWFVINKKGSVDRFGVGRTPIEQRFEVFYKPGMYKESWGHLNRNSLPPTQGIPVFPGSGKYHWNGTLRGHIEGGEGSLAQKMVEHIENSPITYPYTHRYSFIKGPNSNTYVQWVLNQFPGSGLKLPWNAFGKRYKEKLQHS